MAYVISKIKYILLVLVLLGIGAVPSTAGFAPFRGIIAASNGGTCTPALETGDRSARITVSFVDFGASEPGQVPSNMVDGDFSGSAAGSVWFGDDTSATGHKFKYDFGSSTLVTEAKWHQDSGTTHGTWQWKGSTDDVSYDNIGSTFTLGGVEQDQTQLNGNETFYRYLQLEKISGTHSSSPFIYEIEFTECS